MHGGELKAAENILLQIEKLQSGIPDVLHMLGFIAVESGRPAVAVKHLKRAIERVPGNIELLNLLGAAHYKAGDLGAAVECFSQVLSANPGMVNVRLNLADALLDAKRFDEAEAEYLQLASRAPNDAAAQNGLGCVSLELGKQDAALSAFTNALKLEPGNAEIQLNMSRALAAEGRLDEAMFHVTRALELEPDMPQAGIVRADLLLGMGDSSKAILAIEACLVTAPNNPELHRLLAEALELEGKSEDALVSLKKAQALQPDDPETFVALSATLERSNRLEDAADAVAEGLKISPNHSGLQLVAVRLAARSGEHEKALEILEAMDDGPQPLKLRRDRFYELGKAYDRLGRTDQAYSSFEKGNEAAGQMWQPPQARKDVMIAHVDRYKDVVTKDWIERWSAPLEADEQNASPIFMVGFPRSGTTLMGQILDSHPDLQVLDEPPTIDRVRTHLLAEHNDYPDCLATLATEDLERLRRLYFETVDEHVSRRQDTRIVDKMPFNLVEVPLILRLFPDARFIFCLRHPCDACLSCFMQHFEMNAGMTNFLNLEDTARLYESVLALWQRYRELFELDVLEIRYEDLVGDMETKTRDMLEFIGVAWSDEVLDYHRRAAGQNIRTPSYSQVTEEIYTSARYRWERYRDYLAPILPRLQPFIECYGYADTD